MWETSLSDETKRVLASTKLNFAIFGKIVFLKIIFKVYICNLTYISNGKKSFVKKKQHSKNQEWNSKTSKANANFCN